MKFYPHFLISVVLFGFATGFFGCSDDSLVDPSQTPPGLVLDNGSVAEVQEAKIIIFGEEWIGGMLAYHLSFDELDLRPDENGTMVPVDYPMLFIRSSLTPYSGSIIRVHPNGEPEFTGKYENGLLEGVARWWYIDGNSSYAYLVKEGMNLDVDLLASENFEDNKAEVLAKVKDSGQDFGASTNVVFEGNSQMFDQLTMAAKEGDYLLAEHTGNKVTGGFKIYNDADRLSHYSEYKDGLRHGREVSWHENGVKSTECSYVSGLKQGVEIWWGKNGLKIWEANYSNGKQHGLETSWAEDGEMLYQHRRQIGEIVETIYAR